MNESQNKNSQMQVLIPRFINSSEIKTGEEKINQEKLGDFVEIFNESIKIGKFTLNNALDEIPTLNESEFELAKKIAKEDGWNLTQFDDNCNTTSYKVEKIK